MIGLVLALMALPEPADLVIENATIWSDGLDDPASVLAVKNGKFVYVGNSVVGWVGPETRKIDAGGKPVIPGLIDSHIHMLNGGLGLSQLQLRSAASKQDFIQRVKEWAESLPEGKWVLGGRWSVESWEVPEQPTKEWVDPVTGDRPLYLSRMDGHSALANSAALRLAGITRDGPPNPPGGVIDRDPATGEPTGILRETAMGLVTRLIPPATPSDKYDALKRAIKEANRNGITTVCDIPPIADIGVYQRLAEDEELTCRFVLYPTANDWTQAAIMARAFSPRPEWVKIGGFKAYFDGSLGSRTAWMRAPFLNNPEDDKNWSGLPMPILDDGTFDRNARAAIDNGFQVIVHCIGDQANNVLLSKLLTLYDRGIRSGSEFEQDIARLKNARHRSEHTQHLLPTDIERFARLGVIASMQPYHKADDGRYAEEYIGVERCKSSYAFKSLLDAGVTVAFGSDWPVVTINPFLGIEAAVTGKTLDGKNWMTQENISVEEALKSYTLRAAFSCFLENTVGKIAVGYAADFLILNEPIFSGRVNWGSVRPTHVFVNGLQVLE
ncbi:MAG: amidohydrolase [Fimbriimonadales bacterium]|nr:amidohydrolase [Fimbriimonadales bacterium]